MPINENNDLTGSYISCQPSLEKLFENIDQLRLSSKLLLESNSQHLTRPWLLKLIGSLAEAPGLTEDKTRLVLCLSRLLPQNQVFSLVDCSEKEEIVDFLLNNDLPALYEFLQAAFNRWSPKTSQKESLSWLYRVLVKAMRHSQNTPASLSLKGPEGKITGSSKAYLELILNETLLAAGEAWVRRLRSPGGVEGCQEMKFVWQEEKLCEAILEIMAEDPLAFALFVENFNLEETACTNNTKISMLAQGISASDYALSSLIKVRLEMVEKDNDQAEVLKELLGSVIAKLTAVLDKNYNPPMG